MLEHVLTALKGHSTALNRSTRRRRIKAAAYFTFHPLCTTLDLHTYANNLYFYSIHFFINLMQVCIVGIFPGFLGIGIALAVITLLVCLYDFLKYSFFYYAQGFHPGED